MNLHLDEVSSLGVQLLFEHLGGETGNRLITPPLPELVVRGSSVTQRGRGMA